MNFPEKNPIECLSYPGAHVFHLSRVMSLNGNDANSFWNKRLEAAFAAVSYSMVLMLCCVLLWLSEWVQFDHVTTVMWTID